MSCGPILDAERREFKLISGIDVSEILMIENHRALNSLIDGDVTRGFLEEHRTLEFASKLTIEPMNEPEPLSEWTIRCLTA